MHKCYVCAVNAYMKVPMHVEVRGQPTMPSSEMHSPPLRQGLPLAYISPTTLDLLVSKSHRNGPVSASPVLDITTVYHHTPAFKNIFSGDLNSGPHAGRVSAMLAEHPLNPFTASSTPPSVHVLRECSAESVSVALAAW